MFNKSSYNNLNKKALLLSYFTLVYNLLEGLISIFFGFISGSIALIGFGLDSFIESFSSVVMIWRFSRLKNTSIKENENKELIAIKLVGYSFFIFGIYVLFESLKKLYYSEISKPSIAGIIIAIVSLLVMPILYYYKNKIGKKIGSSSLIADSKQTLACAYLSIALLIGLSLNYLFSLWWADPVAGLFIVLYLFKEGYETLKEDKLGCC